MILVHQTTHSVKSLCEALGEPRSSYYRSRKPVVPDIPDTPKHSSPRRLKEAEEQHILDILNSERFCDSAPGEVYATLLDEGERICSERTMYRILERNAMTRIRRQAAPRNYEKPELLAIRPNELWSWDITKLKGPAKWTYFYLYKIIDVFSRYVVGWMVAHRELAKLAEGLIADTILKQEIRPGQLTIHADRGSSMTSTTVGQLLADLGVTKTHSRPHVSNDNPYSECERELIATEEEKIITHISLISYSMYLINLALVAQVIKKNFPVNSPTDGFIKYSIYWVIVVGVSTLIYFYYERPFMNLRDKKFFRK